MIFMIFKYFSDIMIGKFLGKKSQMDSTNFSWTWWYSRGRENGSIAASGFPQTFSFFFKSKISGGEQILLLASLMQKLLQNVIIFMVVRGRKIFLLLLHPPPPPTQQLLCDHFFLLLRQKKTSFQSNCRHFFFSPKQFEKEQQFSRQINTNTHRWCTNVTQPGAKMFFFHFFQQVNLVILLVIHWQKKWKSGEKSESI